ncbi:thioredoxin family protein [Flavitalea sp. BT771]|uniref:thioredoxin family protein n=1 Tax=Flavitalea sp. BT771 TaxID=3063329 RepID=UPI0026E326EA|nr:thioredoxin family protein [Flavitalea sp. BT771]MDO6431598.1 thioredoxin family protein [Flavitalea sp. BT771]MDV6220506.1 thioredoxin family protein [Flavitalea sp. BT771]
MNRILMKGLVLPALGFLSFSAMHTRRDATGQSLPIGAPIPKADVRVKDVSGKELNLQEARQSNGLLVMFTCNTCPYVIRNQSRTNEICKYAQSNKVGVVLLNANEGDRTGGNSFAEMQSYARSQGYQWVYAVDEKSVLADAFGASRTPECYLFDKAGKLVYHGAIDDSPGDAGQVKRHHLKAAIDETLQGKEVSVKETRSVGCSINRG